MHTGMQMQAHPLQVLERRRLYGLEKGFLKIQKLWEQQYRSSRSQHVSAASVQDAEQVRPVRGMPSRHLCLTGSTSICQQPMDTRADRSYDVVAHDSVALPELMVRPATACHDSAACSM